MVAAILIPLLALAILGLVRWMVPAPERARMLGMLLAGYVLRIFLFLFVMRSVAFFSHGVAGGDSIGYQLVGSMIAQRWRWEGVHFVTASEMWDVGSVALPCNVLALLEYLGGEPSPLGGVALNAFVACCTILTFYRFVLDEGTDTRSARTMSALLMFGPSFLYHTSDTYKDGVNAFFVLAGILGSIRLSRGFTWARAISLAACLCCLWFVRSYMVFMCLVPLVVGFMGSRNATPFRRVAAVALVVALAAGAAYSGALGTVFGAADATFTRATSEGTMSYNARHQGSGVVVDSYPLRLLYTIFAPFPWQGGSTGLQLGKLEALIFYYFIWKCVRGWRVLWTQHRSTVTMLLLFIGPGTLAYAATMSNIGLIVRQRMPIVIGVAILAALTMTAHARAAKPALEDSRSPRAPTRRPRLPQLPPEAPLPTTSPS